jgi:4-amino-4-deoxy-L-arabinose transferase-like glycosyltransferase
LSYLKHIQHSLLDKWRLVFVVFASVYAVLLLINLDYSAMRWDEVVHFYSGLQLVRGNFFEYFTTSTFYPPMFNLWISAFFEVGGISLFTGRLVSVTFSLLTVWVLFEMVRSLYGGRIALLSAFFFGIMPGVFWLSRMAYIETMLEFFFLVSLFFFFSWLRTNKKTHLAVSAIALSMGFLTKYQAVVAAVVMLATIPVLGWAQIKAKFFRYGLIILVLSAVAVAWFVIAYGIFSPDMLNRLLYAYQTGDQERSLYSARFPTPVFYLIEMTWPYVNLHPISILLYSFGLLGLGLFALRRKPEDKLFLVWFIVVYVVFTLVGNRQWRYVMPLFPVLAVSASCLFLFLFGKSKRIWQKPFNKSLTRKLAKFAAAVLIIMTGASVVLSCADTYEWVSVYQIRLPVQDAIDFVSSDLCLNETVLVMCGYELFNNNLVGFYLQAAGKQNRVFQYPELPVDTFTVDISVHQLISLCQENNAVYIMYYEFGSWTHFFNTSLTMNQVSASVYSSGRFNLVREFGSSPDRIFIMQFE